MVVAIPERGVVTMRRGTSADASFLAQIDLIASIPPFERSLWDEWVEPTGVSTHRFLEAMISTRATRWGQAEDYLVLEQRGEPMAACAVYEPQPDAIDHRPIDLECLPELAAELGWNETARESFIASYNQSWPVDATDFLIPQAPVIIEFVGVLPEARGQGLGRRLLQEAFAEARRRHHTMIGIMVIHGNEPARNLYESAGFEPYLTYHSTYFEGKFPGLTQYRATLVTE